jgi:signal transduction histidine kinase
VAGIAHEINTPLAYVKGIFGVLSEQLHSIEHLALSSQNFSHLIRSPKRDNVALNSALIELEVDVKNVLDDKLVQEMATLLKDGVYGIEKISEIVLNLKNFSRLDRSKISDFSLSAGLDSTLQLANHLIKDQVIIKKEYGVVPNITCSPSQINQVFLNIITNAIQAMPVRSEDNIITLRIVMESDDMVRVEIQDNGDGIPKEVLPKIFDPFFTTKAIGKGSGMGLSISYKIIQEHGGKILVDTEAGVGTIFSIMLPVNFVHTETSAVIDDALFIGA